jgi:thiamine biosynthesis protein ThiS
MLTVNGKSVEYKEGLTLKSLLEYCHFTYPMLVMRHNGIVVAEEDYDKVTVNDCDEIQVIHLVAGG